MINFFNFIMNLLCKQKSKLNIFSVLYFIMIMMVINQILLQIEVRPFEDILQAYPESILQFIHPVLFLLSHY
jgi:hypothetical protein